MTARAADPGITLPKWLIEFAYGTGTYRGLPESVMATLADEDSPLHASCAAMRDGAARLLAAAQAAGTDHRGSRHAVAAGCTVERERK